MERGLSNIIECVVGGGYNIYLFFSVLFLQVEIIAKPNGLLMILCFFIGKYDAHCFEIFAVPI